MSKGLYEIMGELEVNGFCIFNLEEDVLNCSEFEALKNMAGGFHVDKEDHIKLYRRSEILVDLENLLRSIYEQKFKKWNKIFVTRSVVSLSNEKYRTHFDSHLYTIVIPIVLPSGQTEERGQLYIIPNLRKQPNNDFSNLITKMSALRLRGANSYKKLSNVDKFREIDLKIGEALVFKGMTCLHGNKFNASPGKRVTAITHFGDPFPNGIGAKLRYVRKLLKLRT